VTKGSLPEGPVSQEDLPIDFVPGETGTLSPNLLSHQEKDRAFTLVRKVQGALQHIPDFAETCKAILDAIFDEINAERCSIMLADHTSGELLILASRGRNDFKNGYLPDPFGNSNRFKLREGIAGRVLTEGRAMMLDDVNREPRFVRVPGLNNNVRSLICLPLREHDQVVGVFNLSHSKKGAFDEADKLILSYISSQVNAALLSARFLKEIQEMNGRVGFHPRRKDTEASSLTFDDLQREEPVRGNGIFIFANEKMRQIKEIVDQVANADVTILIEGESGVGKEIIARSIHLNSSRREGPFIKVNCAALPSELLESELFGYEKGAFTGAYRQKPGKFELAHRGTIFLDEIAEISPGLQAKLLQVLQDREFSRIGGKMDFKVDVRVLAATNKNMEEALRVGGFREDLYYRLNVVNITVPPLRERKEEILIFVQYFMEKFLKKYSKKVKPLSDHLLKIFLQYHWPGNVRELENLIHRYVVLNSEETIIEELSNPTKETDSKEGNNLVSQRKVWPSLKEVHRETTVKVESELIRQALEMAHWNRKKAAGLLNISYRTLLYKMNRFGIHNR
jgi:Nif-specific regulatory protein